MPGTVENILRLPRIIEILAFPDVQLLDVAGPLQVFASANERCARLGELRPYELRVVASPPSSVMTTAGLALATLPLPGSDSQPDTLVVAGGRGVLDASEDAALMAWLNVRARLARRVASVCTGAFLLGSSGLLEERRVTTHWARCAELARRFPNACVEPDPIFIRDGRVWSSAGVTAGMDLALALVEEDLGRQAALGVARQLVMYLKRPGGQAQFSAALSLQDAEDTFGVLHRWMTSHLRDDLSVEVLAARVNMSERNFSRRYADETGLTPARAVERLRTEEARRLLSDTSLPIKRVAQLCGFGSDETMRRSFLRLLRVSPQDYRSRFGS